MVGVWSLEFGGWWLEVGGWRLVVENSQSSTESSPLLLSWLDFRRSPSKPVVRSHFTGTGFPSALGVRDRPQAQPAGIG